MDEQDSNLGKAFSASLLKDDQPLSFDGMRFASLEALDHELVAWLKESGATFVAAEDSRIDVLLIDSAKVSADLLRERMSEKSLDRLHQGLVQIVSCRQLRQFFERNFQWKTTDGPSSVQPQPDAHCLVTLAMLSDMLGVTVAALRSWQRRGLIQPVSSFNKLDYFDFQEVAAAKQLATLVELGLEPSTIQKNLRQLSVWMPDVARPLIQLSVLVDGNRILLRQNNGLVEASGQRRLDFGESVKHDSVDECSKDRSVDILPFKQRDDQDPRPIKFQSPTDYVLAAENLEEEGQINEAIEVYRSAQLAFGPVADICLRIGELLFRLGDLRGARERYYMAIELDENMIEARAALGCVLVELGEFELAISVFEGALDLHADYADVHFQLARAFQSAGDDVQASRHWERFLSLSPVGPWAEEARSQLDFFRKKRDSVLAPEPLTVSDS